MGGPGSSQPASEGSKPSLGQVTPLSLHLENVDHGRRPQLPLSWWGWGGEA